MLLFYSHYYVRADKVMKLRHLLDRLGNIPGMMSVKQWHKLQYTVVYIECHYIYILL
jgi:hypothetical protein